MRIDHIAIWCDDIEAMRRFYIHYFGFTSNEQYHNPAKQYLFYFLSSPVTHALQVMAITNRLSSTPKATMWSCRLFHPHNILSLIE